MREYKTLVAVSAALLWSQHVLAQPDDRSTLERESLGVIPAVYVDVVGLDAMSESDPLNIRIVSERVRSLLGEHRIPLMDFDEWKNTIGQPALYVRFNLIRPSEYFYIYHVATEVRQLAFMVRDTTRYAHSRTWSGGELLGTTQAGNIGDVLALLDPMISRFAEDYLRSRREYLQRGRPGLGL